MSDQPQKPFWMPDTQGFLAIAIIIVVASLAYILVMQPIKFDDKVAGAFMTLLGVLTACLKDVYAYFFGSSRGSSAKDDALVAMASTPTPPPAAAIPWWPLLTPTEQAEVVAKAAIDPICAAFVDAAKAGTARPADLDHLVQINVLTAARARQIEEGKSP